MQDDTDGAGSAKRDDQAAVIAFLSRPAAYPDHVTSIEKIETHASVVFLAGDRAYKLKRAIRYPYLDYATLASREVNCRREIEVNRRTAPDLYHRAVPVTREESGELRLDGKGEVVDWLVEMARFSDDALLDRVADAGKLDRYAAEFLADVIARFHQRAEVVTVADGAARLAWVIDNNAESYAECEPGLLDEDAVACLTQGSRDALAQVAALVDQRGREGRVRQCHGDLHLRNIVIHDGRPVPFDAIEFSEALTQIDVLYDLAFLIMDLQFRGLGGIASIVLNRYLDTTGDAAGLAALPFFLALRAGVRGHVDAQAASKQGDSAKKAAMAATARRYVQLGLTCLQSVPPRLIAVGGLSGSGKSRLAREIAPFVGTIPGARVVRTDAVRKRLAGVALSERLPPQTGYTELMTQRTYAAALDEAAVALATGRSVIIDAVFAKESERLAVQELAKAGGVPFHGLWLEADSHTLQERVTRRRHNISDATAEIVRLQLAYDLGTMTWQRVDTSGSGDDTLGEAMQRLSVDRQGPT